MDNIVRDYPVLQSVMEWAHLILLLIIIPLIVKIVVYIIKNALYFAERLNYINKIKLISNQKKASFEAKDIFRSLWKNDGKYELRIFKNKIEICIKLIGCTNAKAKYYLDEKLHMIELYNNISLPFIVTFGFPTSRSLTSNLPSSIKNAKLEELNLGNRDKKRIHKLEPMFNDQNNIINILLFAPVSHEIYGVKGSNVECLSNGGVYGKYLIYYEDGLLNYLKNVL